MGCIRAYFIFGIHLTPVTAGEGCVYLGSAKIGSNRHSAEFFLVYSCLFVLYVR